MNITYSLVSSYNEIENKNGWEVEKVKNTREVQTKKINIIENSVRKL